MTKELRFITELSIPVHPNLQATLGAAPTADFAFICGVRGKPYAEESFANQFKCACKHAGFDEGKRASHALRKIAATRLAEARCSENELMLVFVWKDPKIAAHDVRKADGKKLSPPAFEKPSVAKNSHTLR